MLVMPTVGTANITDVGRTNNGYPEAMPTRHTEPDRSPDRVKDRPTWLLSRAFARSSALLAAGFEEHGDGLRGHHYRLLAALEPGPASQAELGRTAGIDRSDVTASLTELEARELIARRVDPENKRRNIVTITPAGTRTLAALDAVVDTAQADLLAPLTPAQRHQLIGLLRLVVESAE
jgi:DNA-binding MarR family transcriptional regulator